jgi:hypothetical protein
LKERLGYSRVFFRLIPNIRRGITDNLCYLELAYNLADGTAGVDIYGIHLLLGICAGFEGGEWRGKRLAEFIFKYIPEFCLTYSEIHEIDCEEWMDKLRKSVNMIYNTDKFKNRGEFGELLLHCILKDFYKTIPAVSKMYFKDGPNETVKGFDAVHIIANDDESLDLWLGEVKFYNNAINAINDVIPETIVR